MNEFKLPWTLSALGGKASNVVSQQRNHSGLRHRQLTPARFPS